ncbi:Peroxisomal targeting signal receptor, putative [Perkinsus marinus ATCC 50983]|uniref:Peroxisomal targeting signal receptor, putative n=1 Tax=Perkinsus marinus (strain ATCC 50983 / TXsc) TaxID=423536 RepID=C5LKS4_PERM5|nr:Peroxisomal targeting signal receptor, putative [Perkinsus marinus ATCC 50983]EER02678.1 Peroxisomal targeting signal receptor, putative [Perkinsus marinus ATCC 50983]|eukprot:XP_002769981.1 Peroxisomal targeting signal receptor, putative [Perkinsus marinus ATCC 50983]
MFITWNDIENNFKYTVLPEKGAPPQVASSSGSTAVLDHRLAGHMAAGPSAATMDSSFMNIEAHPVTEITTHGAANWAQEFDASKGMARRIMGPTITESAVHQQQQQRQAVYHSMPPPQFYHQANYPSPLGVHVPRQHAPVMVTPQRDVDTNATVNETAVNVDAAKRMVETMRIKSVKLSGSSDNAKFANSQFVDFVDQIVKGDLKLADDKVLDSTGKPVNWEALYDEAAAVMAHAEEVAEEQEQMNREENSGIFGPMDDVWQQLQQEGWLQQDGWTRARDTYEFNTENPYLESSESPLQLALRLLAEGRDEEAMLALEAEVQQHPDSSEGWRLLGLMHAGNDMDVEAITCLEKGHEVDPYNTDSLLALGVSLTNELDSYRALKILREWLQNHEAYHGLVEASTANSQMLLDYDYLKKDVVALLEKAVGLGPNDADASVALGVAYNIDRNYTKAADSFMRAATLRPEDPTLWNKLGATLANSGLSEASLVAYNQALKLKPNYARAWSNLAIAHCNLNQHQDGIRFYLAALKLSPKAEHLWTLLFNAVGRGFDPW